MDDHSVVDTRWLVRLIRTALTLAGMLIVLMLLSRAAEAATDVGYGFDTNNAWKAVTSGSSATMTPSTDTTTRYEGSGSLKLSYDFTSTGNEWAYIERDIGADTASLSGVNSLSLWVYSPASQPSLRIWIKLAEADGSEYESNGWWLGGNQYQVDYAGWRHISVPMASMTLASYSSDPDTGLQLNSVKYLRIGLDDSPDSSVINGSVQLDAFTFDTGQLARAYPMDSLAGWSTTTSGSGSAVTLDTDAADAVEGSAGVRAHYTFSSSGNDWAYLRRDVSAEMAGATASNTTRLTLWVHSPTAQPDIRLWVKLTEADGSEYESNGWWLGGNQYTMDFAGWRRIEIPIGDFTLASYSTDPDTGLHLNSVQYLTIGVDDASDAFTGSGDLTIDDIRFNALDTGHAVTSLSDNTGGAAIATNSLYEATFGVNRTYTNAYDPDSVEADAYVTTPSGSTVTVPAFWYVGYTRALVSGTEHLTPTGTSGWHVRYTPRQTGTYSYVIELADPATQQYIRSSTQTFTVSGTGAKGFLHVSSADNAYLDYDDGSPYVGVGHNIVGWEWDGGGATGTDNRRGTYDFDDWLSRMSSNGANLAQFDFGEGDQLEWTYNASELPYSADWGGLGVINEQNAWKMDYRLTKATSLGVFYRLGLFHWEDFDTETGNFPTWGWSRNPYNTANGGPDATVNDFFSSQVSIRDEERLLRYVIARYGYSTNTAMWELWNEVDLADLTGGYSGAEPAITDWHAEISRFLKQQDPNQHLITTSFSASTLDDAIWKLPTIDVTTFHRYTYYNQSYPGGFPQYETEQTLQYVTDDRRSRIAKPVIAGEFALSPGGDIQRDDDPTGIAFHNQLWASLMSKSLGTAMSWTWGSYIDADNLYYHYQAIHNMFGGADLRGTTEISSFPNHATRYMGLKKSTEAWVWVQDWQHTFIDHGTTDPTISGYTLTLTGLTDGTYALQFYDTYTGAITSTTSVATSSGTLTINVPSFTKDTALHAVKQ